MSRTLFGETPAREIRQTLHEITASQAPAGYEELADLLQAELEQLARWAHGDPWQETPRTLQADWRQPGATPALSPREEPAFAGDTANWWTSGSPSPGVVRALLDRTQAFVADASKVVTRADITAIELCPGTGFSAAPVRTLCLLQELVRWSWWLLSRAKREEHALLAAVPEDCEFSVLPVPMKVRRQWIGVCVLAQACEDAWHWLPPGPDRVAALEASKAGAIYGLALARLGRFNEAHRRLNLAYGLLNEYCPGSFIDMGILELRRAEAHLLEASLAHEIALWFGTSMALDGPNSYGTERSELGDVLFDVVAGRDAPAGDPASKLQADLRRMLGDGEAAEDYFPLRRVEGICSWLGDRVGPMPTPTGTSRWCAVDRRLRRVGAARCDDAWACLERAQTLLAGHTQSPLWWSRLRALQLQAHATRISGAPNEQRTAHRPLSRRVRQDVQETLRLLWREGIAVAPDDGYNRLRMVDQYTRACRANRDLLQWTESRASAWKLDVEKELECIAGLVSRPVADLDALYLLRIQARLGR